MPRPARRLQALAAVAASLIAIPLGLAGPSAPPAAAQAPGCVVPRQLGVVFVVDDSPSMDQNDPQVLRGQGVGLGLRELGPGQVAAMSAFTEKASAVFGPTGLDAATIGALGAQAAGRHRTDGGTNYEAAFVEAKRQLDLMPASVDRKAVIFLSDGEPTSAYSADGLLAAAGIPIFTIGFGDASAGELAAIAQRSGAVSSAAASAEQVQGAMARAIATLRCQKVDAPESVTVAPGQTRDVPFTVPKGAGGFRAIASWGAGQVTARLVRPDGSILGPGALRAGETFDEAPTNARASAAPAPPGLWKVRIAVARGNAASVKVDVDLLGDAQLDHPLTQRPKPLRAGCETEVTIQGRVAWSTCFEPVPDGWRTSQPLRIAGIDVTPDRGHEVRLIRSGRLTSDAARMFLTTSGPLLPDGTITVRRGPLDLPLTAEREIGLDLEEPEPKGKHAKPKGLTIGGLPLARAAGATLTWDRDGASVKVALSLGRDFATLLPPSGQVDPYRPNVKPKPGQGSSTLKRGFGLETTLKTSNAAGLAVDRVFGYVDAGRVFSQLGLKRLSLEYGAADNLWTGSATVVPFGGPLARYALPDISASVGLAIDPIRFGSIKLDVSEINKPVGPGVFLQKLGGEVRNIPAPFAIGGTVGLSAGPKLDIPFLGSFEAVTLDGAATYEYPFHLTSTAQLKVLNQPAADSSLDLNLGEGSASLGAGLSLQVAGNGISGRFDGWLHHTQFQLGGQAQMTLFGKTVTGSEGFVNGRGFGACRRGFGPDFGFVTDFSKSLPGAVHAMASACDFGSLYLGAQPRAAGAGVAAQQAFRVRRGSRGLLVRVRGSGGQPAVTLTGPGGRATQFPAGQGLVQAPGVIGIRDEANNDLWLVLDRPRAGAWTVAALPGGPALEGLGRAAALPEPRITARLRRVAGGRYALVYRTAPLAGQRLRFVERGPDGIARPLTTTRRARGVVRFRPAPGRGGRRSIEVTFTQGATDRRVLTAARFRTGTVRPAAVRRVLVVRSRAYRATRALRISWTSAREAAGYVVRLKLRDGRTFEETVGRLRRSLTVPAISTGARGTVSVRAVSASGILGAARSVRLR